MSFWRVWYWKVHLNNWTQRIKQTHIHHIITILCTGVKCHSPVIYACLYYSLWICKYSSLSRIKWNKDWIQEKTSLIQGAASVSWPSRLLDQFHTIENQIIQCFSDCCSKFEKHKTGTCQLGLCSETATKRFQALKHNFT